MRVVIDEADRTFSTLYKMYYSGESLQLEESQKIIDEIKSGKCNKVAEIIVKLESGLLELYSIYRVESNYYLAHTCSEHISLDVVCGIVKIREEDIKEMLLMLSLR